MPFQTSLAVYVLQQLGLRRPSRGGFWKGGDRVRSQNHKGQPSIFALRSNKGRAVRLLRNPLQDEPDISPVTRRFDNPGDNQLTIRSKAVYVGAVHEGFTIPLQLPLSPCPV
jgi:hypothetical protein